MDITINTELGILALISFLLGIYFTQFQPRYNAWVDSLPDNRENVWKRVLKSGTEDMAPHVEALSLFALKVLAPFVFLILMLLMILSPLGHYDLAMKLIELLNYPMYILAIIVFYACMRQVLFLRKEKKKRQNR